ncbi:MAG: TlyA family RNA methyltransferase [Acidobacteriaceae bacterium]|nr:TlyA family RNA methyltransferase [Acidobacteriaceae bacterium]MBV9780468.1 TlyA family RNA methyltransferase [Acidobacteriaceae bacterium]
MASSEAASRAHPKKQRLDRALVDRQLVETREKAQALILSGKVKINGQKADKPGRMVSPEMRLEIEQPLKYVSRGGFKLEAALERFGVPVMGRMCVDVGTSTGGFTDCLLQHGAARVHAVDTGAGQIHWKLRTDERVVLHEHVNARHISFGEIGEFADLIACDVSFISVTLLIPALAALLAPQGDWIILVKPQFEVGREMVGKGGIVLDTEAHRFACDRVITALEAAGFRTAVTESPILGAEGNREFLVHAKRM